MFTKAAEFTDKHLARLGTCNFKLATRVAYDAVSEVRHIAISDVAVSVFTICIIDENIINWFHNI